MQNEYEYCFWATSLIKKGKVLALMQDYHVKGMSMSYMHGHHTKQFKVTCTIPLHTFSTTWCLRPIYSLLLCM